MERITAVLQREGDLLETLLFKLVETSLILESGDTRFLSRATREVEQARARAREVDLVRATSVAHHRAGATLRDLASEADEPWPGILRDHHDHLTEVVAEIEVIAHGNAKRARIGLDAMAETRLPIPDDEAGRTADLTRLARGAALETVMGTAGRLRMPDLLEFLR